MRGKKKAPFPTRIEPMLASLVKKPFDDADWVYEVKWDGYRVIAYVNNGKVALRSRGDLDYTRKFEQVARELTGLPDCVLDGEIVVLNDDGKPDFSALQNYQGSGDLVYYIFDLLYLDGESYLDKPLLQRKEMLLHVITKEHLLTYSDHYSSGIALFDQMEKLDLEGIIAKKKESIYLPGKRSNDWLKVKIKETKEYVIGGWSSDNDKTFKTILFGEYVDGKLRYVHHSGGGYTSKEKLELFVKMRMLQTTRCPFINESDVVVDTSPHWCRPLMVATFEISNKKTKTGIIRHPAIFKGLRDDKKPVDATRVKQPATAMPAENIAPSGSWETVLKHPVRSKEILEVAGRKLTLNNIEHQFWHNVTKADLIGYYIRMADYILPYLKDRPLGINISPYDPKESFFLRGMEGHAPKWATVFKTDRRHKKASKSDKIEWLVCNDLATLVWTINLNCIDIHPWGSRTAFPDNPDYITIDLDPSDGDFNKVIETARAAKRLLDKNKLAGFVKTSGKSGMHIYIPCRSIAYGQSRTIAENICQAIHELVPSITTTNTSVNSRGNSLYVDPSQNDYADRLAAPYCVRAGEVPAISTPLGWEEVKPGLDPARFTIHTAGVRVKKKGDLWSGLMDERVAVRNEKALIHFL